MFGNTLHHSLSTKLSLLSVCLLVGLSACSNTDTAEPTTVSSASVLTSIATNVIRPTYTDLRLQMEKLDQNVATLASSKTDANLAGCRDDWRAARAAWESSEGFLFGPVETDNVDPHIDTWPVAYSRLDSVLSSDAVFNEPYMESLEDDLKGFHPIEYILFGTDGQKSASALTQRELSYLSALTTNVNTLTDYLATAWDPSNPNNYYVPFTTAGVGNQVYPTVQSAYEELVNAMSDICNEVANEKMKNPFEEHNPALEESPFSGNSIRDFTSNIQSTINIYEGFYGSGDGLGLEDFVRQNNLSLDTKIKDKQAAAIGALGLITDPFGKAISTEPTQIVAAMAAINDLQKTYNQELLPFVQQYAR